MDPYAFANVASLGDVITSAGAELGEPLEENVELFLVVGGVCCVVVEAICCKTLLSGREKEWIAVLRGRGNRRGGLVGLRSMSVRSSPMPDV